MREIHRYISAAITFCLLSGIFISNIPTDTAGIAAYNNSTSNKIYQQNDQIHSGFFTENKGQWDPEIKFSCTTDFGLVIFQENGIIYRVMEGNDQVEIGFDNKMSSSLIGRDDMGFPSHFFLGNDPDKWVTGVRSYRELVYENVWPGIDIEYYFKGPNIKYDLIVQPEADPNNIKFKVTGQSGISIDNDELSIIVSDDITIKDRDLVAMSDIRTDIPVEFKKIGTNGYSFQIDKRPDERLVIDPLVYSTVIGGTGGVIPGDIVKDDLNCTYFFSTTYSPDVPITPGANDTEYAAIDYHVMKMNSSGTGIVFATYIGGWSGEIPQTIKVDDRYDIYLAGRSTGLNFPTTPGVIQEDHNSVDDITLTKLSSKGDKLIYSTFIGGDFPDTVGDIEVVNGNVYLAGYSMSHDLPSMFGPIGGVHGILFFSIINSQATAFLDTQVWDGYYGETPTGIDVNDDGEVVIGGYTQSNDFPITIHSFQQPVGNLLTGGFIIRYDPNTQSTIFASKIGECIVNDVKFDENSDIFYGGTVGWNPYSSHPSFPITNDTYSSTFYGWNDAFVGKLLGNGTELEWCTVIGGSANETGNKIELDEVGNVYLAGTTASTDLPCSPNCYNGTLGGDKDVFFFKMSNNGSNLLYSTYFGTSGTEEFKASLLGGMNNITLCGSTSSVSFPVTDGSYRYSNNTDGGMFLSSFTIRTVPGSPTNFSALEGDGNITLSWIPPLDKGNEPIINYSVYRGPDPNNLTHYDTVGPDTEYLDTAVDFGIEYHYAVSAINVIGEGPQSEGSWNISATTPDPPMNIKVDVNIGGIVISFDPPVFTGGTDITHYEIYRNGEVITTLDHDVTIFADTNIGLGAFYTYNLTASNRKGGSDLSKGINVRSKDLPSVPKSFSALFVGKKVILKWEEPEYFGGLEIDRYVLYKGESPESLDPVRSLQPDVHVYEDTYVYIGNEYYYSISAFNMLGESDIATPTSVIPIEKPSVPEGISATPGVGHIDINWSHPTNNGGDKNISYRLFHGTSEGSAVLLVTLSGDKTSYRHEPIYDLNKHHYFVTAFNMVGESERTDTVYASAISPPLPPVNIIVQPGKGVLKISWEKPIGIGNQNVLEYVISRRTGSTNRIDIATLDPGLRKYTDSDLDRKTTYFYSMRTVMGIGSSGLSGEVSGMVISNPDPPINVKISQGDHGLLVSWDPPIFNGGARINWFSIYRTDPIGLVVLVRSLEANETNFEDNSVDWGNEYSYYIEALNDVGTSGPSSPITGRMMNIPLPPKIDGIDLISGQVVLSWSPNSTISNETTEVYNIYRSGSDHKFKLIARVQGDVLILLDDDLQIGEIYQYNITAENRAGESSGSNVVFIEILDNKIEERSSNNILTWGLAGLLGVILLLIILLVLTGKRETLEESNVWEEE